ELHPVVGSVEAGRWFIELDEFVGSFRGRFFDGTRFQRGNGARQGRPLFDTSQEALELSNATAHALPPELLWSSSTTCPSGVPLWAKVRAFWAPASERTRNSPSSPRKNPTTVTCRPRPRRIAPPRTPSSRVKVP